LSQSVFLIPNLLGEAPIDSSLPALVATTVRRLRFFIVEDERSARRIIKILAPEVNLRELSIVSFPRDSSEKELASLLSPSLHAGNDLGVISEAGCPGIADPGREVARYAHKHGILVKPLVGPCSMVLALMSSGLNGQSWRFVGYLPIDAEHRRNKIKELETRAKNFGETQIFMETPYRNDKLLAELLSALSADTLLCIASGLTTPIESIKTKPVKDWRCSKPTIGKAPCLFLVGI
jgi:16S rRNA (cytidine1402-2'-O)-methyltransferase